MTLSEAKTLLGIKDGYSLQEAKSARNRLARRYHPDINEDSEAADEAMKRVNEAYQLLVDSFEQEQSRAQANNAACRNSPTGEHASYWEHHSDQEWPKESEWDAEREWHSSQTWEAEREWEEQQERKRREAERRARQNEEQARRERGRRKAERQAREQEYRNACKDALEAKTADDHVRVAALFRALGTYRDSDNLRSIHESAAEELRAIEREKEKEELLLLRKLNFLPTLTMTVASTTVMAMAYINGGVFGLIISFLYAGGFLPINGLLQLVVTIQGHLVPLKDGNIGQLNSQPVCG